MEINGIAALLAVAIVAGTPLLYAAMGEVMAERSGILNLGVEGMMLVGAVSGFMVTIITGNHWIGILAAAGGGAVMAAIHAFITITLKGNQVVSGLALTIFGTGTSGFLGKNYVGMPAVDRFTPIDIPYLCDIPVLGTILFKHDAMVYLSIL